MQFAKWCLDLIRHYISFRIFFSFRSVGGPDCWRMLCNLSVNCDPLDTTRYDGKNTVVKRLACVRGSILFCCAPISQFPSKNFKGKYSKKNQSHKISERKNNFVLSFTKNVRLFKHHDLLACVIVCNSCENSWFWQPENTLITHYSVRICADVWPLCWQSRVCHTTLRRLGRRKQRLGLGKETFSNWSIITSFGSLRNDEGDAIDEVGLKMNLYFTSESHDTLKSL